MRFILKQFCIYFLFILTTLSLGCVKGTSNESTIEATESTFVAEKPTKKECTDTKSPGCQWVTTQEKGDFQDSLSIYEGIETREHDSQGRMVKAAVRPDNNPEAYFQLTEITYNRENPTLTAEQKETFTKEQLDRNINGTPDRITETQEIYKQDDLLVKVIKKIYFQDNSSTKIPQEFITDYKYDASHPKTYSATTEHLFLGPSPYHVSTTIEDITLDENGIIIEKMIKKTNLTTPHKLKEDKILTKIHNQYNSSGKLLSRDTQKTACYGNLSDVPCADNWNPAAITSHLKATWSYNNDGLLGTSDIQSKATPPKLGWKETERCTYQYGANRNLTERSCSRNGGEMKIWQIEQKRQHQITDK